MSSVPTTYEHVRALAAAVRDGELTPEQRTHMVTLLHDIGTAVTLAPRAQKQFPGDDARVLGYLIGTWAPVERAYVELAATVRIAAVPAS
jgi:hypothetical protein